MPNKQDSGETNPFFEFVKGIWAPIAGLAGAIVLLNQLIQVWKGDSRTTTILLGVLGLGLWVSFLVWIRIAKKQTSRKRQNYIYKAGFRRIALYALVTTIIGTVVGGISWKNQQNKVSQERAEKVIVVIAQFDGPEEIYGLRDEIKEQLDKSISEFNEIEIILSPETIATAQGSEFARELGKQNQADLVMWGWYRPTENPNITIHLENLSQREYNLIPESSVYKPQSTIAELETVTIQQEIGEGTAALVSFLSGVFLHNINKHDEALIRFEQALNQPNWAQDVVNQSKVFFYMAESNYQLRDYKSAILNYERAIAADPQFVDAYINQGSAYGMNEQYDEAFQSYNTAIALAPDSALAYVGLGGAYSFLGDEERSVIEYTKAIEIDPTIAIAYNNRGISNQAIGNLEEALMDFNQAIEIEPRLLPAYINRGSLLALIGKYDKALEDYNYVIDIDIETNLTYDAYVGCGIVHIILYEYEEAFTCFEKAIKVNPQRSEAYYHRGIAYYNQGHYEQSINEYSVAIRNNPQLKEAFNNRGNAYMELKQYDNAIADFSSAIEIDQEYAPAYINRGLAYQVLGKQEEAEADFAKYKELEEK